jgi:hypothetical protein
MAIGQQSMAVVMDRNPICTARDSWAHRMPIVRSEACLSLAGYTNEIHHQQTYSASELNVR